MKPSDSPVVEVQVEIAARPETVFSFLSDPVRFQRWMGKGSEIAPRPGGEVVIRGPGGPPASGRILEWVENTRVVFTWSHGAVPEGEESRVAIDLTPAAGGTLVTVRHSNLQSEAARRGHTSGWRFCLATLSAQASLDQSSTRREAVVDASLAAWTEPDASRRASLLDEAFADEVVFRDPYASLRGRAALGEHIENVQQMSPPGATLSRSGPVEQCHGHVRFAWKAAGPDGVAFASGTNFADLSPDGRLARVVGFWDGPAAGG